MHNAYSISCSPFVTIELSDSVYYSLVPFLSAMAHVEAGNIHALLSKRLQNVRAAASRSDSADDLGAPCAPETCRASSRMVPSQRNVPNLSNGGEEKGIAQIVLHDEWSPAFKLWSGPVAEGTYHYHVAPSQVQRRLQRLASYLSPLTHFLSFPILL